MDVIEDRCFAYAPIGKSFHCKILKSKNCLNCKFYKTKQQRKREREKFPKIEDYRKEVQK